MNDHSDQPIVVKFLGRGSIPADFSVWTRQFPGGNPIWGNCRFTFDPNETEYDWLAVYDDLPSSDQT